MIFLPQASSLGLLREDLRLIKIKLTRLSRSTKSCLVIRRISWTCGLICSTNQYGRYVSVWLDRPRMRGDSDD